MHEAVRSGAAGLDRLRAFAARRAVWRAAATLAALLLAIIVFFAAPGSVELVPYAPAASGRPASTLPSWARPCLANRYPTLTEPQLAFCARADGRVIGYVTKDNGERHVLVMGGFHLTLVELPPGAREPAWGSRITAVGPLTTTDGLREVQTIRFGGK